MEEGLLSNLVSDNKKSSGKKLHTNKIFLIGIFLILAILIFTVLYLFQKRQQDKNSVVLGSTSTEKIQSLLEEVGEKIELPIGETPTIATVTDVTKLEGQPFFRNAKNGDKVIIYGSTKKAILYRPSTHKIIDIAPINMNADNQGVVSPQVVQDASQSANPSISPSSTSSSTLK